MSRDACTCPDGRVRVKLWHLFAADDEEIKSVCGMAVFGQPVVGESLKRTPGAILPHCFTLNWEDVNCAECTRIMEKGLPT